MVNRQMVIEKSINVENIISILITHKYFPGEAINSTFLQQVLCDPHANTAFKVNVFMKCYPDVPNEIIEKLRRLFNIRNLYAHCGLHLTSIVDPDKSGVLDPEKVNEPLDFAILEAEFLDIEQEVHTYLDGLIATSGLKWLDEDPSSQS